MKSVRITKNGDAEKEGDFMIVRCDLNKKGYCEATDNECEHACNHHKLKGRCEGWKTCIENKNCRCVKVSV